LRGLSVLLTCVFSQEGSGKQAPMWLSAEFSSHVKRQPPMLIKRFAIYNKLDCMKTLLRRLSWSYLALLALAAGSDVLVALSTRYGERSGVGCNFYDAMLIGIECRGFWGAETAQGFLNWPLMQLYVWFFASAVWWLIPVAILLWLPLVYLAVTAFRRRHAT
jgi:hypothetical protein